MNAPQKSQPIFALDPSTDWEGVMNAMEASVQYCSDVLGGFGPLFAFAPMTEPANPDRWEPMTKAPKDLLLVSIARAEDKRLLKAFQLAEPEIGPLLHDSPTSPVRRNASLPIADVYRQMEQAGVTAYCITYEGENDASFFFVRGTDAIRKLDGQLRTVARNVV
jgi:hypothetical protein